MTIIVDNIVSKAVVGGKDLIHGDIHKALREHLRIRPKNYGRIMLQMKRRGNAYGWDGYTYFINKNGQFATGFLASVIGVARDMGVDITIEDKRQNIPDIYPDRDWEMPEGFKLVKHQKKLIRSVLTSEVTGYKDEELPIMFHRGIWKAATNARKTAAAGALLNQFVSPKAIMLVDSEDLLHQHYSFYKKMFPVKGAVGFITSGKQRIGSVITIAMVKTLFRRLKKSVTVQRDLKHKFNILIVDECHSFCGKEAVYTINHIDAGIRLAMSGTPLDGADRVASLRLVGMFGNVLYSISKRYLMDNGFSLVPEIEIHRNPTEATAMGYAAESAQVITESEQFAELVADIICKNRKKKVLIPFFEHNHGELLYNTFIARYPTLAHKADWVDGIDKLRAEKIAAYISGKISILFASTILQQGINISDIEVGINALAEKSAVTLSQFMGRMERLDGKNTHFKWVDFWHSGKYLSKHSRKRLALYKKEDYPTPIVYKYQNRRGTPTV